MKRNKKIRKGECAGASEKMCGLYKFSSLMFMNLTEKWEKNKRNNATRCCGAAFFFFKYKFIYILFLKAAVF